MKKIKESGQSITGINIAPVINVALVLVLVLLMTAPLLDMPTNIPVNLPEAVTEETKERNIAVSLAVDGRMAVNSEPVTLQTLVPVLKNLVRKDKNAVVIVRADKDCYYGDVEELINIIKNKIGPGRISVATKQIVRMEK
ncbi:MAG: biopolymer transporter ExbD [bacterium]